MRVVELQGSQPTGRCYADHFPQVTKFLPDGKVKLNLNWSKRLFASPPFLIGNANALAEKEMIIGSSLKFISQEKKFLF